jgi:hypothetical protein
VEEKCACHACIQPLTTSADLFARHRDKSQGNTSSNKDKDSDDKNECYSIHNNSESSMTSDGVGNQTSMSTNKSKKGQPHHQVNKQQSKIYK